MFPRFGIGPVGSSDWFAVFEQSNPEKPQTASPTRVVAICTSMYFARFVTRAANRRSSSSPGLQEDSGAWRLEEGSLYEENLRQVWHLSELPNTSLLAIYGTAGKDEGQTNVFALSPDDAEFVTASMNYFCQTRKWENRYAWRQLGS